jgi:integrase/recombinase XerD
MLDIGLRMSEVACIRLGDLRADGMIKVRGKGSHERIVPVGSTARQSIVRYLGQRSPGGSTTHRSSAGGAKLAPGACSTGSGCSRAGSG